MPGCDPVRVLQLEKAKAQASATGLALVQAQAPLQVFALLLPPRLLASDLASDLMLVPPLSGDPTGSRLSPSLSAHGITLWTYGHRAGGVKLDEESMRT